MPTYRVLMGTWEVEVRSPDGALSAHRRVQCRVAGDVETLAGIREPSEGCVYVYRVRRARGRQLHSVRIVGGDSDGTAGVREPRRPLPGPGHLSVERDA